MTASPIIYPAVFCVYFDGIAFPFKSFKPRLLAISVSTPPGNEAKSRINVSLFTAESSFFVSTG